MKMKGAGATVGVLFTIILGTVLCGSSARGDTLSVTVTADPNTIAPGESSLLVALASGGVGPYMYDWDPGPNCPCVAIEVWPTVTTTYTVTVTDSLLDTAQDQVTVTVATHTLSVTVLNGKHGTVTFAPDILDDPNDDPNDPNALRRYPLGTDVVLTAVPVEGSSLRFWKIYDPNYPGDEWYVTEDTNLVLQLTMDADWEVEAVFKCGTGMEAMFPLLAVGLWGTVCRVRRHRWY